MFAFVIHAVYDNNWTSLGFGLFTMKNKQSEYYILGSGKP